MSAFETVPEYGHVFLELDDGRVAMVMCKQDRMVVLESGGADAKTSVIGMAIRYLQDGWLPVDPREVPGAGECVADLLGAASVLGNLPPEGAP